MHPNQIALALKCCVAAKRPVMMHGSPGVGKSQMVHQLAKEMGVPIIDLRLSQLDPVDLRGVPSINTKTKQTNWNAPDFLPKLGAGILFFDEINSAAQATQAAAYQLILDRKLGDYTLPPDWVMIAAGNRSTDRAIVNQMSTALKNRFTHINFEVSNDDWCDWALKNDISTEVLGFIRFRPTLLNEFESRGDSKAEKDRTQRLKDVNAFATPRSWETLDKILKQKPDKSIEFELYSGVVGEGCAVEFMGYLKYYRDLPNIDALLLAPKTTKVPTEPATLYALSTGIAARATPDNYERVIEYTLRMPPEFQVLLVKDSLARDQNVSSTRAFNQWATKNADVLYHRG